MAQARIDAPTTTIQPQPGTQPTDVAGAQALANEQIAGGQALQKDMEVIQQVATQVMKDETLKQAQQDASQVVNPGDIEGKRGIGGILYNQAYEQAAVENYRGQALAEAQGKAQELVLRYPTNPAQVSTELTAYLDAKKKAMPEYLGNTMTPHFQGVLTGAVNSATAGKAREDMATLDVQSKRQLEGFVLTQAQAKSSAEYLGGSAETRAATDAKYDDQWKMVETQLRGAGHGEATIADIKAGSAAMVAAHVYGRELQQKAAPMALDPVGLARLADDAEKWAKDPSRAAYYNQSKALISDYLAAGIRMAGATREAIAINQQFAVGRVQDDVAKLTAERSLQKIDAGTYEAGMNEIKQRALNQGLGKLPGQQAQLLAAAGSPDALVGQAYSSAMLQAAGRAQYGATEQIRAAGLEEVKALNNDPLVIKNAPNSTVMAGLLQQGQRIVAGAEQVANLPNTAAFLSHLSSGNVDEANMAPVIAAARAAGFIGPTGASPEQVLQAQIAGTAKAKEIATRKANAGIASQTWNPTPESKAAPTVPSAENVAAREAYAPFKNFTVNATGKAEEKPFDPHNPQHIQQQLDNVLKEGYLSPQFKQWTETLNANSSLADQQILMQVQQGVRGVAQGKYANQPDSIRPQMIEDAVSGILGDSANAKVRAFTLGAGDPAKTQAAMGIENYNRNQPNAEAAGYATSLRNTVIAASQQPGPVTSMLESGVRGVIGYASGWLPAGKGASWEQSFDIFKGQAKIAAFSGLPAVMPGREGYRSLDQSRFAVKPENVFIDENASNLYTQAVTGPGGILDKRGQAWRDQGLDPYEMATLEATRTFKDRLSRDFSIDPTTGETRMTIRLNDFYADFNRTHGTAYDKDKIDGIVMTSLKGTNRYFTDQIDPNTMKFSTRIINGQTYYSMSAMTPDHADAPAALAVRPDDPAFQVTRQKLIDTALQDMPSISRALSTTWGPSILREYLKNNNEQDLIDIASGRNLPAPRWTELVSGLIDATEAVGRMSGAVKDQPFVTEADRKKLLEEQTQNSILRFGSLVTLFGGIADPRNIQRMGTPKPIGGQVTPTTPAPEVQAPSPVMPGGRTPELLDASKMTSDELIQRATGRPPAPPR